MTENKRPPVDLTEGQWQSLSVLGYLWLRLGSFDKAERTFKVLALARPDDGRVTGSLAAAALGRGEAQSALDQLEAFIKSRPLATAESHLLLLKAQALWRLDRAEEASAVIGEYLAMTPAGGEGRP